MGSKNKGSFIFEIMIMFILFLSMIRIVFNLGGRLFYLELLLLLFFILITVIILIGIGLGKRLAWPLLILFFTINWINQLFIYALTTRSVKDFSLPFMVVLLGFLVALIKTLTWQNDDDSDFEEHNEMMITNELKDDKDMNNAEEMQDDNNKIKAEHVPGKFVASSTGKVYHAPKCDWAKKIKDKNKVWLDSEKEAEKQGYEKHSCLEE